MSIDGSILTELTGVSLIIGAYQPHNFRQIIDCQESCKALFRIVVITEYTQMDENPPEQLVELA